MALSDLIEKLGRTIFEAPFSGSHVLAEVPELAEMRLAILDEIQARSHSAVGRDVFPYNLVRICLRGIPAAQSSVFEGGFLTQYFEQEVKAALARKNYRFPEDLRFEVSTQAELPGPDEKWLWIETASRAVPAPPGRRARSARLVVVSGGAEPAQLVVKKARTNIGRTVDVYRADGPSRRNDLAFAEDNEIGRSVSREHAHIVFNRKSGEYRLFNDRHYGSNGRAAESNCGLWIIRDGLSQPVHQGPRGAKLEPGDEIHLGRAVVRFQAR